MKKDLKELAKTALDVAKGLAKDGKLLSKNPEYRMNICLKCECYKNGRCSREICKDGCNCYMPVKIKLEHATCPRKKW